MFKLSILEKEAREKGAKLREEMEVKDEDSQPRNGWGEFLAWSGPFVLLGLFVPLARLVKRNPILELDIRISHIIQRNRSPILRRYIKLLTYLCGSPKILRTSGSLLALVLWKMRLRQEAILTGLITVSSAAMKDSLQHIINRPRPSPLLVQVYQKSHGKSFPSGHVIASFSFWGWLMALSLLLMKRKQGWQKALLGVPALLIGITGPTRIYLGDHWASDVLGGYLFGGAWLGLFVQIYGKLRK